MCRFLIVKSEKLLKPWDFIFNFAEAAKKCCSYDGDWQGDGWGVSWLNEKNEWKLYKSLLPIWEDNNNFSLVPLTNLFVIHARSASFEKDKNNIDLNQPYINNKYAYVFNGLIKSIKLPFRIKGAIGAQKIWNILQQYLNEKQITPFLALNSLKTMLLKYAKEIQAANIALINCQSISCLTIYNAHPSYYQLKLYKDNDIFILSSLEIKGFNFGSLEIGVYEFNF
jgi:predicted glutamine amidotransferase